MDYDGFAYGSGTSGGAETGAAGSDEEKLQGYIKDSDYKMVLSFCIEPKAWDDIRKLKIKQSKLFQMMKDLKVAKGLEFNNGKYFTASFAKEMLK